MVEQMQKEILAGLDDEEYEQFIALAAKAVKAAEAAFEE